MSNLIRTFLIGIALLSMGAEAQADEHNVNCIGCVDTVDIAADAVTSGKIANNAVRSGHIRTGAVRTSDIADDAVTSSKIADKAVRSGHIRAGAVRTSDIAENAVSTRKIRDGAVTVRKVAPELSNSIDTSCPAGQAVIGKDADGNYICESKKAPGIISTFSGTFQQFPPGTTGTTSGPFMCPIGEGLSISTTVVYFSAGICDDIQPNSAGLPACDGRFTARVEGCSDPGRDIKFDGGQFAIVSGNSRGQVEFCFASAASGASLTSPADCWGAGGATGTTAGTVYATGTHLTAIRLIPGLLGSPVQVTGETTLISSTKFTDGNRINVDANQFNGAISHIMAESNVGLNNCGFAVTPGSPGFGPGSGCGLAGVIVGGK